MAVLLESDNRYDGLNNAPDPRIVGGPDIFYKECIGPVHVGENITYCDILYLFQSTFVKYFDT